MSPVLTKTYLYLINIWEMKGDNKISWEEENIRHKFEIEEDMEKEEMVKEGRKGNDMI